MEERFPVSQQGYTVQKLLDGTECQILLDTGSNKSFISKTHYLIYTSLHLLPKFASRIHIIQVENKHYVSVLFMISLIIDMHGQRFEIFTLVSVVHKNEDLGMKNIFELESIINHENHVLIF